MRKRPPAPRVQPAAPMPATLRPEKEPENKPSWEFRSAKFALRCVGVCFFIAYLCFLTPSAITWVETKWVRAIPVEELSAKADYYLNQVYKPEKLYKTISKRPISETERIIEVLMPHTARMSTFTFLYYSSRLEQLGKRDEALFWWQFGRYRARFDALRCGSAKAVENVGDVLNLVPHPEFPPDEQLDKFTVEKSLKRVLELDAKYPADNIPEDLCEPLRAMEGGRFISVGHDRWADIRYTLRYMTEYRLKQMAGEVISEDTNNAEEAACAKAPDLRKKKECRRKLCAKLGGEDKKTCLKQADALKK
ncbi:MAG TPA: hypothetical protein VEF76_06090 [Patescibacteria group bacterium]|nr:hypothetical protein [Patescibacteria group bacterium]